MKAIYVLRYLFSTVKVRCVYDSLDTNIYGYSDSAFAFHSNGLSSSAIFLSVGKSSAPFMCQAKAQSSVAPDVVAGEYYSVTSICLHISHFRQLSQELGWEQPSVTVYVDSKSAINLALAPVITKKARHMRARYHLIREYVLNGIVTLVHVQAADMRADVLTKVLSNATFLRGRDSLLNWTA